MSLEDAVLRLATAMEHKTSLLAKIYESISPSRSATPGAVATSNVGAAPATTVPAGPSTVQGSTTSMPPGPGSANPMPGGSTGPRRGPGRPPKNASPAGSTLAAEAAAQTQASLPGVPIGPGSTTAEISYEVVRKAVLDVVEKKGHLEATALLAKYNAKHGKELKPEHYAAVLDEARRLVA